MRNESNKQPMTAEQLRMHHVNRLILIQEMPDAVQRRFSKLETYHMVRLHRTWFSSSKRERYAKETAQCSGCMG